MLHTDIVKNSWIEALPERYRSYAVLARLDRPIGIWLLLLPGWWSIVLASGGIYGMGVWQGWLFVLFGVGAVVMRAAGCVVNDLWDRELDQKVARTQARPLASGVVLPWQAFVFLLLLLLAGSLVLAQMNRFTFILGLLVLPLIAIYPLMKRYTWWPQAFLGVTFNFGALMGWSAVTGGLGFAPIFLYAGGILWTLGYDTIYAHQDRDDDMLAGIRSTALLFGERSKKMVALFYGAAWLLMAVTGIIADYHSLTFLFLVPALGHLAWQVWRWDPDDAASSLRIFKSNRDFGLIALLAFALG